MNKHTTTEQPPGLAPPPFGPAARTWQLQPSPKYALYGVERTVPPRTTIKRVQPLMPIIGVTRVGEVTYLDRMGIPNFIAARPRDGGEGISYYNGKGLTRAAARAGAMMEAIERYSADWCLLPVFYLTQAEMAQQGATVDPCELLMPSVEEYEPGRPLEWVEGFDLLAQQPAYVPLNAVVCPYEPPPGRPVLFYASTNGLASGNTREEALCHALCEVIERDACAVAAAALELAPAVGRVLAGLGLAGQTDKRVAQERFPLIDLHSLPARATALVQKMWRADLQVYLRAITSTAGVPTLDCTIVERLWDGRCRAHGGCGTHPDARVALFRALTEAAQSRVGCIQGGREDLPEFAKPPSAFDPDEMFGGGPSRPFSSVPSYQSADVSDDIRFLLRQLAAAGFTQVVALDLTRPETGVPVVRIVIPRAEAWSVFHMHTQRGVFGARVGQVLWQSRGPDRGPG